MFLSCLYMPVYVCMCVMCCVSVCVCPCVHVCVCVCGCVRVEAPNTWMVQGATRRFLNFYCQIFLIFVYFIMIKKIFHHKISLVHSTGLNVSKS